MLDITTITAINGTKNWQAQIAEILYDNAGKYAYTAKELHSMLPIVEIINPNIGEVTTYKPSLSTVRHYLATQVCRGNVNVRYIANQTYYYMEKDY